MRGRVRTGKMGTLRTELPKPPRERPYVSYFPQSHAFIVPSAAFFGAALVDHSNGARKIKRWLFHIERPPITSDDVDILFSIGERGDQQISRAAAPNIP